MTPTCRSQHMRCESAAAAGRLPFSVPMWSCRACSLTFDAMDDLRAHYKTDWHRYNLKRKMAGVGPISFDAFEMRRKAALMAAGVDPSADPSAPDAPPTKTSFHCKPCNKSFLSRNAFDSHVRSKKHKRAAALAAPSSGPPTPTTLAASDSDDPVDGVDDLDLPEVVVRPVEAHGAGEGDEEEDLDLDVELSPRLCIFCPHESADFESNLHHMTTEHDFFIPDLQYVCDLEGLVQYLVEKVYIANICLYCEGDNMFRSAAAVQQHMRDKSHMKIRYELPEHMEEFEEFYDFSALGPSGATESKAGPEDDEDEELEDDGLWYPTSTRSGPGIRITDTGELILASGKLIGHRQYAQVYKQNFRPGDTRTSAVVSRLALEYGDKGLKTSSALAHSRSTAAVARKARITSRKFAEKFTKRVKRESIRLGVKQNKLQGRYFRLQIIQ